MNQIMKFFMGIFLLMLLTCSSIGILGAFLQVITAQDVHAMMIDELENSDYSLRVLEDCFQRASQDGYELELILYDKEGGSRLCITEADIPSDTSAVSMALVHLKFPLEIPLWGMVNTQEISGYAR